MPDIKELARDQIKKTSGAVGEVIDSARSAVESFDDDELSPKREGHVARSIESQTAKIPSDWFMWAAFASIGASAAAQVMGRKEVSNFIGHWAPTLLIFGVYNKIVKVAGSDRMPSRA